jgi:hypothetical protein
MNLGHRLMWIPLCSAIALVGCNRSATPPSADALAKGGSVARRSVKTAMDADASKITLSPEDTTVENIAAQKPPSDLSGRTGPFETTTWRVKATIESVQLKKDGDYYMVLRGDKGGKTVVEVPDPKQCEGSPMHEQIAAARKQLEDKYHPTEQVKKVDERATVTGVGFLGWGSSSKGAKGSSGARLMPGTGFDFGNKG